MPEIPTRDDISRAPVARSGRAIARQDTTAIGRGMQNLGAGIADLGAGVTSFGRQQQAKKDLMEVTSADTAKTTGFMETRRSFEQDGDYGTYEARADAATEKVINEAAARISNPERRAQWLAAAKADAAVVTDSIRKQGAELAQSATINEFDRALEVQRQVLTDPVTTSAEKEDARAFLEASISAAQGTGLLTPDQAEARRENFVRNGDYSRAALAVEQDPKLVSRPLPGDVAERSTRAMDQFRQAGYTETQAAGIVGNLIGESRLKPDARNPGDGRDGSDSIGIGQWNGDRARALRAFASARGRDWKDLDTQIAFVIHELETTEAAAGRALKSATTVDAATAAFVGFERPAGWSANNPRGAHNYRGRLQAAQQALGQDPNPAWFDRLTPEQKASVYSSADTANNKQNTALRGTIEAAEQSAPIAVMNTGSYNEATPSPLDYADAYGAAEGARRYEAFQSEMKTARTAHDMQTMPSGDIRAIVQDAVPSSSGGDAAIEQARYDTLARAATTILTQRDKDPVGYVHRVYPEIAEAWQAASTGAEGAPTYSEAMARTIAAQEGLGITRPMPLPGHIAASAAANFSNTDMGETERLKQAQNLFMATSDPEQRRLVTEQLIEAGLPTYVEGAFEAMDRGDDGAASRLFFAAMTDPNSLPGKLQDSTATINEEIQASLMDEGQLGEVYYGLMDGDAGAFEKASRGGELLSRAVKLRMARGADLRAAIDGASRDLFGDVKVELGRWGLNTRIVLPAEADANRYLDGFAEVKPGLRDAVADSLADTLGTPDDPTLQVIGTAVLDNRVNEIMAEGYFAQTDGGFVYIDPYTGGSVVDKTGQPIFYSDTDILAAADKSRAARSQQQPNIGDIFGIERGGF